MLGLLPLAAPGLWAAVVATTGARPSLAVRDGGVEERHPRADAGGGGGELGSGHGSRDRKEGHDVTENEFQMSVSLLAIVVTIVTLFYFVLNKDKDICFYTWNMLSKGITIFLAVGVFNGLHQLAAGHSELTMVPEAVLVCLCLLSLHTVLLLSARRKDNMASKTFGGMVGHMTAFAWIRFWSSAQRQMHLLGGSWKKLVYMVVPVAFMCKVFIMRVGRATRETFALMGDARIDDREQDWIDKSVMAEMEAGALLTGFLVVQTARYLICGESIDELAAEQEATHERGREAALLMAFGALAQAAGFSLNYRCGRGAEHGSTGGHGHSVTTVSLEMVIEVLSFSSGWCFIFTLDWLIGPFFHHQQMLSRLTVAMVCTYAGLLVVFFMDKIADSLEGGATHMATRGIIASVGMLVGFSWERCFDHAVEAVCRWISTNRLAGRYEDLMAAGMGAVIAGITLPAMYWYVHPITETAMKSQREEKK